MVVATKGTRIIGTIGGARVHSWLTSKDVVVVFTKGAEVDLTNGEACIHAPPMTLFREGEIK